MQNEGPSPELPDADTFIKPAGYYWVWFDDKTAGEYLPAAPTDLAPAQWVIVELTQAILGRQMLAWCGGDWKKAELFSHCEFIGPIQVQPSYPAKYKYRDPNG